MAPRTWWILGAAGALVLLASGGYSYGGAAVRSGIDRNPANLLPGFARKLDRVFKRMRAQGFTPMLWEGRRSAARAAELAAKGTGSARSLHILGAAADVVNGANPSSPWSAPASFWSALGAAAEAEGLTWGGRWANADKPHVQAIPVNQQNAFWAANDAQRAQWVA